MLVISDKIKIPLNEIEISAVRSQGAGGQNVNKVASAVHLRFDINASCLPAAYKSRLLRLKDRRVSKEGVIVIKAQQHRTQERNKQEALDRLAKMIRTAAARHKRRKPTRPTLISRKKRVDRKVKRGRLKELRRKINSND